MPSETSESEWIADEAVILEDYIGDTVHVTFDDEIEFTYRHSEYSEAVKTNNIYEYDCWSINSVGKHKRKWAYTFTDEDYDRAVAANAKEQ